MFDKIISLFLSVVAGIFGLFHIPYYAVGEKVDMDKFELVWSDEFDGESVDWDKWTGHYAWETNTDRKGSVWNKKMAAVKDGHLIISTKYYENGLDGGHAGFYNYGMDTSDSYRQTYGYFECRCILPRGHSLWGAFWLYCEGVCDTADKGKNGAEIDVFESQYYDTRKPNTVSANLHIDGYEEAHKQLGAKKYLVKGDPYSEFNTYGVEWNSDGYTFYINGQKSFSTDWGGPSEVPEFLILSVEISGENGIAAKDALEGIDSSEFVVDYVRAYQYKSR